MQPGEPAKEPIKLYLDDQPEPFKVAEPPIRFRFSTIHLPDGPHTLRIEASNGLAPPTIKSVPFSVRNGVALSMSGLEPNQTIGGQVELIINAYAGNTEVDFEPKQAETPQPIPTWAWVLLLAVMSWSLYYLVTPHRPEPDDTFGLVRPTATLGKQIYMDTCARCHGEDGLGRTNPENGKVSVAALRNTKELGVARSPFKLLSRVVTGVPGTQMPAWGPLLNNEEIVSAVNHVRTWWGHDASTIQLSYRFPPKEIEVLECNLAEAMKTKDVEQMAAWGWPTIKKPVLFRIDDDKGGYMGPEVQERWAEYFKALCDGKIVDFKLREVRYDYEPETANQEGSVVIAMGRVYLESLTHGGKTVSEKGRFIRVYQRKNNLWNLALDFADIPFEVGCDPEELAAIEGGEGEEEAPGGPAPGGGDTWGYADVQALFKNMGKDARAAPHANFWEMSYQDFVNLNFDYETENGDVTVRMVTPYSSKKSNLVIALEMDKPSVIACTTAGQKAMVEIRRMPVGAAYASAEDMAKLKAWIDAGCPEVAGEPSVLPNVPPDDLLCPGGGGGGATGAAGRKMLGGCGALLPPPTAPAAGHGTPPANDPGGFPAPGGNDGGFPAPGGNDGGFPAPKDEGGFPAPKDDGGFPPPKDEGGGGFPPPKDAGGFPPPGDDSNRVPPDSAFPPPKDPKKPEKKKESAGFPPPEDPPAGSGRPPGK